GAVDAATLRGSACRLPRGATCNLAARTCNSARLVLATLHADGEDRGPLPECLSRARRCDSRGLGGQDVAWGLRLGRAKLGAPRRESRDEHATAEDRRPGP